MEEFRDEITRLETHRNDEEQAAQAVCNRQHKQVVLWRSSSRHFHSLQGFVEQKDAVHNSLSQSRSTKRARLVRATEDEPEPGGQSTTTSAEGSRGRSRSPRMSAEVEMEECHECGKTHTRGVGKLSLNCLFAGRNNNNFDLCRPPGN